MGMHHVGNQRVLGNNVNARGVHSQRLSKGCRDVPDQGRHVLTVVKRTDHHSNIECQIAKGLPLFVQHFAAVVEKLFDLLILVF